MQTLICLHFLTVDASGVVTMKTDAADGVAIYAKDNESGVTGVYWIN